MKRTLIKIALVVVLVLSAFLLILRFALHESQQPEPKSALPALDPVSFSKRQVLPASNTSAAGINSLIHEANGTLERKYKSVASEIEDFLNARKSAAQQKSEQNISESNFTSQCAVSGAEEITLPQEPKEPVATKPTTKKPPQQTVRQTEKEHVKQPPKKNLAKKAHTKKAYHGLPRLVIIMDDVRSVEQGRMIKSLPVSVTPSIFPATADHPDTPKVARMFACYMVHTPMEAFHYPKEEEHTLRTGDSFRAIDRRIAQIKHNFPRLAAINNHTGSKFTSDTRAMDRLFCALKKYGIRFVDSRTAPTTKACQIGEIHGEEVLSRNIFLDNVDDAEAILERIRESVAYAKKHKVAIAICHPRPATFAALREAPKLLKGVRVVTIDALYR